MFVSKALATIEDKGVVSLVRDFITERKTYVEIGHSVSTILNLDVGCPQGSTLGPKVLSLYWKDLIDSVDEGLLIPYADDSYVVVVFDDLESLKEKADCQITKHIHWLWTNGMVCNESKTEAE